jgi:quinolinate synthase
MMMMMTTPTPFPTLAPVTASAEALPLSQEALLAAIQRLKREKKAVVLAHVYERLQVQDVADYRGDSLGLSQQAAATEANMVVFCGVHFMAETAKLLSPHTPVYLANPYAGCPMADMITPEQLREFKAQHPGVPVVAYVNTSAAVKAESTICCTSANAVEVVRSLNVPKVLFVPDKHLGAHVQEHLPEVEVVCWDGFCPAHLRLDAADVARLKQADPHAIVLAHPECDEPLKALADFVGSTTAILAEAHANPAQTFIICTEEGVAQRLQADLPHKRFWVPSAQQAQCPNMKMTRLEHLHKALLGDVPEITIEPHIAQAATASLQRMLAVTTVPPVVGQALAGSAACRCQQTALAVG